MRTIGILFFALAVGCTGVKERPPSVAANTGPLSIDASLLSSNQGRAVAAETTRAQASEKAQSTRALLPAGPRPPAIAVDEAIASEQPRRNEDLSLGVVQPEPPLDVAALKSRLRDANTIGALTKLVLKDQVDELLNRFRAHYQRGQKTDAAVLRQPYDMLVFKMLALVQDRDPSLARTISGSREAIWCVLADPEKFSLVT